MIRVQVERIAGGTGDAVGHADDGRVVFADAGLPGDVVEGTVRQVKRRFARLDVERIVTPGPASLAEPGCPQGDACGGCRFWRADYAEELRWTFAAAEDAVRRLARDIAWPAPERLTFGGPAQWRHRARMRPGARHTGYRARRSHDVVDAPTCAVLHPVLDEARRGLDELVVGVRGVTQIHLDLGDDGAVRACVDVRKRGAAEAVAAELFAASRPPLPVAALVVDDGLSRVMVAGDDRVLRRVACGAGQVEVYGPIGAFSQAHAVGNRALQQIVVEAARSVGAETAVDLFAGSGNLTFPLVGAGLRVLGLEGVEAPVAAARDAWTRYAGQGDDRARFDVADLRTVPEPATLDVDLVVTDPPRGGMTPELVDAIGASRAGSLVYVSCDPPAMARDMVQLATAGFVVSSWRLLDLFPRTAHIEAVVVATRSTR